MARKHKRLDEDSVYDDNNSYDEEEKQSCTLVVVIVSLLFVAVFGGALVGGVVSEDPSNGFFVTIIAASSVAILLVAFAFLRYMCKRRSEDDMYIDGEKGTFSSDDEEAGKPKSGRKKGLKTDPYLQEFDAVKSSDVSALSPNTYDVESVFNDGASGITSFAGRILLNKSRQRKTGFDFSSVVSGNPTRGRADPPDYSEATSAQRPMKQMGPRDPSAARITKNGRIQTIDEENDREVETPSSKGASKLKIIDVDDEESGVPLSTKSPRFVGTPGSVASSIFRGFFGGKKKDNNSTPRAGSSKKITAAGRPPMPNATKPTPTNRGLETIDGGLTNLKLPSTPGNKPPASPGKSSVFSIPPPRRVPSSPGGASEAAKSGVSEGVASSTFDPTAHQIALEKMSKNTASLGATGNDMPMYYEEDEDSVQSGVYDVFAPPGPIGIVVDTTEKGCVVHSLRKSSSMQGLINPGDLIIALDDEDVQKMDASALTKLMAKKAQQTERKFTLIATKP